ncbi:RNA polymerase sigma factor [Agarilytica rhodophyticola]|uniref:RNA polymerase sigma factor n=1 Tax=Agarilytica rhodophyticola TaxID=1737490 RepID=UPI000B349748|nr:RNA polymerase sigma factor [Agarilytica rhodophyticola]
MRAAIEKDYSQDLNKLLKDHRNQVFNMIKKKVYNRDTAEDLLQDTFLEAHKSFHTFRQDSKFSTWLIGIAMNIIRNYYNRAPECRYGFVDDSAIEFDSSNASSYSNKVSNMEHNLIANDILGKTLEKVDAMPCEVKDIFKLTVQENLPYKDIAGKLNTSVSNIKVKIFRAREKLKEVFDIPVFEELY